MTIPRFLLILVLIVSSVLAALSFGNPQWGRAFYMWQAYVIGDCEDHRSTPKYGGVMPLDSTLNVIYRDGLAPKMIDGEWSVWDREGRLAATYTIANGVRNGRAVIYSASGALLKRMVCMYVDDKQVTRILYGYDKDVCDYISLATAKTDFRKSVVVYSVEKGIDRRKELGIE